MAKRILIVEDEPVIAESLKAILDAKGYETDIASDGPEAIQKAREEPPDLMLLDIMLPKLGGYDVCRILKGDPETKPIKIVMVTGLGRMGEVETAFQNGADDYLIKPIDTARLLKKLDKVIGPL